MQARIREEQQEAGIKFIEYLTSDETAEQLMAETCGQALPYKNANVKIESPLGLSTADYIAKGLTYDFYGTPNLCPSDIWYECGAYMCEYLAGACDRETTCIRNRCLLAEAGSKIARKWKMWGRKHSPHLLLRRK